MLDYTPAQREYIASVSTHEFPITVRPVDGAAHQSAIEIIGRLEKERDALKVELKRADGRWGQAEADWEEAKADVTRLRTVLEDIASGEHCRNTCIKIAGRTLAEGGPR